MRYVYAGGMKISFEILESLCLAGEVPMHVFAYPPSLSHRSNYCSMERLQRRFGFPLTNLENINDQSVNDILKKTSPDWFMVFGWSQLIKEDLLSIPKYGTLGFHMTKLPEGRGRAPVAWTVIKGYDEGWASLIWLKPGADNGEIAVQRSYPIVVTDDAEIVVQKVNRLACEIIRDALPEIRNGTLSRIPQDEGRATYWPKRTPGDGIIDWNIHVKELYDFIRGITHPFPGAFSYLNGKKIMIWKAGMIRVELNLPLGEIIGPYYSHGKGSEAGIAVSANGGLIIIKKMEEEGSGSMEGDVLIEMAEKWKGLSFEIDFKKVSECNEI